MSKIIYKNAFYVYMYLRAVDSETAKAGTPYYVGKGTGNRAYGKHKGIHVPTDPSLIVIVENHMYEPDAFVLEISRIKEHGRKDLGTGILHNRTHGGEGASGRKHTPETKDKIRDSNTGKIRSPPTQETRDKQSKAKKGKKQSSEHIENSAVTRRGTKWFHNPVTNEYIMCFPGTNVPEGFIPGGKKGRKQSSEHRAKTSAAIKGRKCFHNPVTNKSIMCFPGDVPDGYIPGRNCVSSEPLIMKLPVIL